MKKLLNASMLQQIVNVVEPGVFDEPYCKCVDCQRASASHREIALTTARAVLQIMREPTEEMLDAGAYDLDITLKSQYQNMIDAALKDN